jgi:hypothetical protein
MFQDLYHPFNTSFKSYHYHHQKKNLKKLDICLLIFPLSRRTNSTIIMIAKNTDSISSSSSSSSSSRAPLSLFDAQYESWISQTFNDEQQSNVIRGMTLSNEFSSYGYHQVRQPSIRYSTPTTSTQRRQYGNTSSSLSQRQFMISIINEALAIASISDDMDSLSDEFESSSSSS